MVPITSKFVADLKRVAEMHRRMKEFEELGKLINKHFLYHKPSSQFYP